MKVVQINVIPDSGSTGRTMKEVHWYLKEHGVESKVVYGHGRKPIDSDEYRVVGWVGYYVHNVLARLFGSQGWHSLFATKRLVRFLKSERPDVIHLRNLHGNYLHLPTLFSYLGSFPGKVVWTTHDFWMVTGGCYFLECPRWMAGTCGKGCPFLKRFPLGRASLVARNMELRKRIATMGNLVIQCNSSYAGHVMSLSVLRAVPRRTILNWIDLGSFQPREPLLPLHGRKPVIQVAWAMLRRGDPRFERFVAFARSYKDKYRFRMLGLRRGFVPEDFPFIEFVDPTNDVGALARFYQDGDVFLNTSTEDTFGKVGAESLSCGVPIIVFDCMALPELVGPKCGLVLRKDSSDAEIEGAIEEVLSWDREEVKNACRKYALGIFNYEKNCEDLLVLYREEDAEL